jgi:hypothetical protein
LYFNSPIPRILEDIIRKNAEPGRIYSTMPEGTDEVGYSNVAKTESGRGCGLGHGGYWKGDVLTGNHRDNEELP